MATTQFGVNHNLAVKLWAKKLLREAIKTTWFKKFMGEGKDSLIYQLPETKKTAGDKVTYGLRTVLSGNGVSGDGTLEGVEESLNFYNDSVTLDQLRHAVRSKMASLYRNIQKEMV